MKRDTGLDETLVLQDWSGRAQQARPQLIEDPTRHRQAPSPHDRGLNRSTIGWLNELPRTVVPLTLATRFPRIVNRLARFWDSPGMIEECFKDLLVDRRGGRKGFPDKILDELYALAQYYCTLHEKMGNDLWDAILDRGTHDS